MPVIICFRCRKPVDPRTGLCISCGRKITEEGVYDDEPEHIRQERHFLFSRALELTDPIDPRFMGYYEETLKERMETPPHLPLGAPQNPKLGTVEEKELVKLLKADEPWVRALAAINLAVHKYRSVDTVLTLVKGLQDRDSDVRRAFLWALGKLGTISLLGPLLEFSKIETDKIVKKQLAATLYAITNQPPSFVSRPTGSVLSDISKLEEIVRENPQPPLLIKLGRLLISIGQLLKAVGYFSRAVDEEMKPLPEAMVLRSQCFLFLGKPLFALDDIIDCPVPAGAFAHIYLLHRAALLDLAAQIVRAAEEKGLQDYARLFKTRLEKLKHGSNLNL